MSEQKAPKYTADEVFAFLSEFQIALGRTRSSTEWRLLSAALDLLRDSGETCYELVAACLDDRISTPWACPRCGCHYDETVICGKYRKDHSRTIACHGFTCECETPESEEDDHGTSFSNPCRNAHCSCCGWTGTVPKKPRIKKTKEPT